MPKSLAQSGPEPSESAVLTKAVTRAASLLSLTQRQVGLALGLSGPTVSRLFAGKYALSRNRAKEWELGVLLVRLFRSLDAIWGHEDTARTWLRTYNSALAAAPIDLLASATGLIRVVDYLDHARGRV
jgi:uncharacterized protein (DUF2384 family)